MKLVLYLLYLVLVLVCCRISYLNGRIEALTEFQEFLEKYKNEIEKKS